MTGPRRGAAEEHEAKANAGDRPGRTATISGTVIGYTP
jgi:hypothetical protein